MTCKKTTMSILRSSHNGMCNFLVLDMSTSSTDLKSNNKDQDQDHDLSYEESETRLLLISIGTACLLATVATSMMVAYSERVLVSTRSRKVIFNLHAKTGSE